MTPEIQAYIDARFQILRDELLAHFDTLEVKATLDLDSFENVIDKKIKEKIPHDDKVVAIEADVNILKNKIK